MASTVKKGASVLLPAIFRPHMVNGTWHAPLVSRRRIAQIRKETLLAGEVWPYDEPRVIKPVILKGHKRDRLRVERYVMHVLRVVSCAASCVLIAHVANTQTSQNCTEHERHGCPD